MSIIKDMNALTLSLGVTALAVGGVIIGKKYLNNKAYDNLTVFQRHLASIDNRNCFTIDRLIDADCNGLPLSIGVNSKVDSNNILSHQGIRLGNTNESIKKLISFIKADNGYVYEFEDNVKLTLTKNEENGKIIYSYISPQINVIKEMSPAVVKSYKPISMISYELDKIADIIKKDTISQPKKDLQ